MRPARHDLTLRPQSDADGPFLAALFRARKAAELAPLGFAPAQLEALLAMQERGRLTSYRARYPGARWRVAELDREPVGQLVDCDEDGAVYVVDICVAADRRGQGVGAAMIAVLVAEAQARGLAVAARVEAENAASLALFASQGFSRSPIEDGRAWRVLRHAVRP